MTERQTTSALPKNPTHFRSCLVLGANSFTGAHFIDYLLRHTDLEVVGVSRSPQYAPQFLPYAYQKKTSTRFHFHQLCVNRDLDAILSLADQAQTGLVANFSAQGEVRNSWKWPEQWYTTNCMSVVRLTEALRQRSYLQRYIAVSTPEVYGATGVDTVENETYRPSTPYGASKLAGDLHIQTLVKHYGFPAVFTRAANLFGIHQQLYRIIPRTVIFLKLGRKLTLHGGGTAERAFIHARDVSDASWRAATLGAAGEVYHVAPDGELRSIASVVRLICELLGRKFEDSVEITAENFGQDARFSLDAGKARRELGWAPAERFETAIEEVVRWVDDNWTFLSAQPLDYVHVAS